MKQFSSQTLYYLFIGKPSLQYTNSCMQPNCNLNVFDAGNEWIVQ